MTNIQIWAIAVQQEFIDRVMIALVKAAINIASEAPETVNHANRVVLARSILSGPRGYATNMAIGIATDATVQATPTDDAIYNAVSGQWNAYAGVSV